MLRRSARSAFAPDAFVFPGGTVDDSDGDANAKLRTLGLEGARLAAEFRAAIPSELPTREPPVVPATGGALMVAALRELFEETGVLLACTSSGQPVVAANAATPAVAGARAAVRAGRLTFAGFLEAHGWFADARALAFFSHWITPASEPRRYNTHFFLAPAPADQAAIADADETHDGVWIAPREALERHRAGRFHLVYPTIKHLERLAGYDSVEAALAFARSKPVLTIEPDSVAEGFTMPASLENAW